MDSVERGRALLQRIEGMHAEWTAERAAPADLLELVTLRDTVVRLLARAIAQRGIDPVLHDWAEACDEDEARRVIGRDRAWREAGVAAVYVLEHDAQGEQRLAVRLSPREPSKEHAV